MHVPAAWQPRLIARAGSTALETMLCTVKKTPFRASPCYLALNHAAFRIGKVSGRRGPPGVGRKLAQPDGFCQASDHGTGAIFPAGSVSE